MNILLTGQFDPGEQAAWAQALAEALPGHRLLQQRGGVADTDIDVAVVANPLPGSLQGLPGLRLIQSLWAGVDRLVLDATLPAGVPIARMVDPAMNAAMAETAVWATLALQRGFFTYARQQRSSQWLQHAQRRADEVPVLLLGFGQMARAAAARLLALGFTVTAWRRGGVGGVAGQAAGQASAGAGTGHSPAGSAATSASSTALPGVQVILGDDALAQALPRVQVLINLLPLTPQTRGIVDARLLAALPRGAGLVNLARGGHVVDADLLAALDSGQIGHAVLDVFHAEPLPASHAFWQHPAVTVLPHVAAQTDLRSAAAVAAANLQALADGRPVQHLVARDAGY